MIFSCLNCKELFTFQGTFFLHPPPVTGTGMSRCSEAETGFKRPVSVWQCGGRLRSQWHHGWALVGCRWRVPLSNTMRFAWEPKNPKKKPGMEMDVRIPGPQKFWLLRLNAYPHESHPNILVVLEFFSHLEFSGCFV